MPLAFLADGHLHVAPLAAHEQLGELVHLHVRLGGQTVQHLLDLGILRAERLLEPLAQGLQVEEVEIEDPVEGREVARLLHQRGGERALERLAVLESDLGRGGQGVQRLAGRDAQLGPPQVADELENALVHLSRLNVNHFGLGVGGLRPSGAHRDVRSAGKPFALAARRLRRFGAEIRRDRTIGTLGHARWLILRIGPRRT